MKNFMYLFFATLLWVGPVKAEVANITPKYFAGLIRAYRALGNNDTKTKAKTICELNDKYQTALKSMGAKKTLIIPLDLQANVFLGIEAANAAAFGQKLQEMYATELKTCQK
jgi:hypothetical protein